MSNAIFEQLQKKANESEAIGGTLKFVIDELVVFVDGSETKTSSLLQMKKPIVP